MKVQIKAAETRNKPSSKFDNVGLTAVVAA